MNTCVILLACLAPTRWPELPPQWPTVKYSLTVQSVDDSGVYPAAESLRAPIPDELRSLPGFTNATIPECEGPDCPPGST